MVRIQECDAEVEHNEGKDKEGDSNNAGGEPGENGTDVQEADTEYVEEYNQSTSLTTRMRKVNLVKSV